MSRHSRKRTKTNESSGSQVTLTSISEENYPHREKPKSQSSPPVRKTYDDIDRLPREFRIFLYQTSNIDVFYHLSPELALHTYTGVQRALKFLEEYHPSLKQPDPEPTPVPPPPPPKVLVDKASETDTPEPVPKDPALGLSQPSAQPASPPKPDASRLPAPEAKAQPKPPSQQNSKPRQSSRPVKKQVQLVVHLAGKSDTRYFKDYPTEFFQLLVQNLKRSTPGVVPLGFHISRKGNMLIAFPNHIPRLTLMSNLDVIRSTLNVGDDIRITFDTPWSTIHLANVPARLNSDSAVFSEAELKESLLNNPAISSLDITSHPRWLRKPENITGARSSVVLSFEDPDGAIARSLLKTSIFIFGAPVTVKPWLAKPIISTRACSRDPRPPRDLV